MALVRAWNASPRVAPSVVGNIMLHYYWANGGKGLCRLELLRTTGSGL